jgi:hypothetical protein
MEDRRGLHSWSFLFNCPGELEALMEMGLGRAWKGVWRVHSEMNSISPFTRKLYVDLLEDDW